MQRIQVGLNNKEKALHLNELQGFNLVSRAGLDLGLRYTY